MPSPFPGMNPYLEQDDVWHNFHEQFCTHCLETLVPQVRPGYIVKLDEHVYIHELSADERRLLGRGDVAVASTGLKRPVPPGGGGAITAPVQARVPTATDVERQSFIEIRDRRSRDLIAVIELLSPANKRSGADREQYLGKRRQLLASAVHFVELDLLRGGIRMPVEDLPDCHYYAMVSRAGARPQVDVWPLRLRDPLPLIPIPLREPDGDAQLNLQTILHRLYDAAGYSDYIYEGRPQPPLHPDDAAWAEPFVPTSNQ